MEKVVLGVDIGTSAVKTIVVNQQGQVLASANKPITTLHPQAGFSEQHPDEWVQATKDTLQTISEMESMRVVQVEGMSFSGQMHGLVLVDQYGEAIRPAILWNDTRTTEQCEIIKKRLGQYVLGNPVLEGFTLTKMMWVKQYEPSNWERTYKFLLPKDYVRFKLTGVLSMEVSDASSTLLLDPKTQQWSYDTGALFGIDAQIFPDLTSAESYVGNVKPDVAKSLGLNTNIQVFGGGGDNACAALGSDVVKPHDTLCSIGTSGVILTCEANAASYGQNMHLFQHALPHVSYIMGVTLAAGDSLAWFQKTLAPELSFDDILLLAQQSSIGANGLLFTPYLSGERTPHGDAYIRGSWIGLSSLHTRSDMARAVIEGISYSLYESILYLRENGKSLTHITATGGGAKSDFWLQLQADIFNASMRKLSHEEGPSMGAAIIAATGVNWFDSMEACSRVFVTYDKEFHPDSVNHQQYKRYFDIYRQVYTQSQSLTEQLLMISEARDNEITH